MLASGLGVYRFVMIGQISREQYRLVRPAQPQSAGGQRTIHRSLAHNCPQYR